MTSARSPFATPTERLATYFDIAEPRATFEDRDIDDIALLLEQCGHIAARCPRTYILFRTIGHLDTLAQLVQVGFSDQWFPVETRSLPSFLEPSVKSAVVQHQGIILTKSLDLENGRHRHFTPGEALPFEILGRLGSGGYGQVDRIVSRTSFRQYALKRIRRRAAFGNSSSREAVKGFLNEMNIMRSLEHRHIVQYIGSYTDKSYLGLVMSPVAEMDLAGYNERMCEHLQTVQADRVPSPFYLQDNPAAVEMSSNLRTFFGCLTAALTYLHDQNIRHKDIKPQNILIAKGNVLFSDFGLSRDFADDVGSTTSGITPASPRYCAPEVANYEARNTSSDIWSLGCVFLEMTAALQGFNVDWIKNFYIRCHSQGTHFHANPTATTQLIQELRTTGHPRYKRILTWVEQMISLDRTSRPTAARVLEMITTPEASDIDGTSNMFCGICCVPDLESDSMDSLTDDFATITAINRQNPRRKMDTVPQADSADRQVSTAPTANEPHSTASVEPEKPHSPDTRLEIERSVAAASSIKNHETATDSALDTAPSAEVQRRWSSTKTEPQTAISAFVNAISRSDPGEDKPRTSAVYASSEEPEPARLDASKEKIVGSAPSENVNISTENERQKVFGTPLLVSIKFAYINLTSFKTVGGSYLSGPIPIVVAKCGAFLRKNLAAGDAEDFFKYNGLPLSKVGLLHIFDANDFGRRYRWEGPWEYRDCARVLYVFLSELPEPLIRTSAARKIVQTLERTLTHHEKIKAIQAILRTIPNPYYILILYIIDLFAYCLMHSTTPNRGYARKYYQCLLGGQNRIVMSFMVNHAAELLGGSIAGEVILGPDTRKARTVRSPGLSDAKETVMKVSDGRIGAIASSRSEGQASPSNVFFPNLPNRARQTKSTLEPSKQKNQVPPTSSVIDTAIPERPVIIAQFLAMGVTQDQLNKYSHFVEQYIEQQSGPSKERRHRQVFGSPVWISCLYAEVSRSTRKNLGSVVNVKLNIPIVVAKCCTFLIKNKQAGQYVGAKSKSNGSRLNCFHDSTELGQERIGALVSLFDLDPTFGAHISMEDYTVSQAGSTLHLYLSTLPEPLIPAHVAIKLLDHLDNGFGSPLLYYTTTLQQLPRPNYDTLMYLLAFFSSLKKDVLTETFTFNELVAEFQSAIVRFDSNGETGLADAMVHFILQNAISILESVNSSKPEQSLGRVPSIPSSPGYVTAMYDFDPAVDGKLQPGDLPFKVGDHIRVISKTDRRDDWWVGELRGKQGIFPANYTTQLTSFSGESPSRVDSRSTKSAQLLSQGKEIDTRPGVTKGYNSQSSPHLPMQKDDKLGLFFHPSDNKSHNAVDATSRFDGGYYDPQPSSIIPITEYAAQHLVRVEPRESYNMPPSYNMRPQLQREEAIQKQKPTPDTPGRFRKTLRKLFD